MSETSAEGYLSNLAPDLQAITRELCEVARKNMPGSYEFIYHEAVGYSVSESPFDRMCYSAPQKGYVNFGFFFGAELPDPKQSLTAEGKRMRHVKISSVEDAKNLALGKLIAATWEAVPESIAKIHAGAGKTDLENKIH